MKLGLGGYRIENGPIRLKRTASLSKACTKLEESGNFTVSKTISIDAAKEILGQFGMKAKKASQILPKTGVIDYCAAHGSAQLSSEGKQIYSMVEHLRKPISSFIFDNLSNIIKVLRK